MSSITHAKDRDAEQNVVGEPRSTKSTILETGAAMTQANKTCPQSLRDSLT
jgi:hypothetical protein